MFTDIDKGGGQGKWWREGVRGREEGAGKERAREGKEGARKEGGEGGS